MSNIAEVQKMPPLSEEHPVIVNGLPTKAKLLWQYLVRRDRVLAALHVLKQTNHLYNNVIVDETPLSKNNIEDAVPDDELKAMLREISHDEHIHLVEQFLMHPLDFHDTVEPAAYFQQVPVTGEPLDSRGPSVECMAFPHLYPTGKFGKHWP